MNTSKYLHVLKQKSPIRLLTSLVSKSTVLLSKFNAADEKWVLDNYRILQCKFSGSVIIHFLEAWSVFQKKQSSFLWVKTILSIQLHSHKDFQGSENSPSSVDASLLVSSGKGEMSVKEKSILKENAGNEEKELEGESAYKWFIYVP